MTYNGNANVIILGHGSVFEEIRSHVADLVAMNQVRRSFWIDTATYLSGKSISRHHLGKYEYKQAQDDKLWYHYKQSS